MDESQCFAFLPTNLTCFTNQPGLFTHEKNGFLLHSCTSQGFPRQLTISTGNLPEGGCLSRPFAFFPIKLTCFNDQLGLFTLKKNGLLLQSPTQAKVFPVDSVLPDDLPEDGGGGVSQSFDFLPINLANLTLLKNDVSPHLTHKSKVSLPTCRFTNPYAKK